MVKFPITKQVGETNKYGKYFIGTLSMLTHLFSELIKKRLQIYKSP